MTEYVYIHIPFCIRKCNYCSFVSGFDMSLKGEYLNSLKREITGRYKGEELKTIYFGGGTPSLLNPAEISEFISFFNITNDTEITLECNPETVYDTKFKEFFLTGVNRISLGVQTFNDKILSVTGRKHREKDIYNALETIKSSGFNNISIDLIYGLMGQKFEDFEKDLKKSVLLDIQHISTYGLKIEPGCLFYDNPPDNLPDNDTQADFYEFLCAFLAEHGFKHYEISNFSKPGYFSRHNTAYWRNKNYYGFGLNASGYEGKIRYTNTADINEYIKNPEKKSEQILIDNRTRIEEEIFLALRLSEGIDIQKVNAEFNIDFEQKYAKILKKFLNIGLLKLGNKRCFLTEKGFLLSNEIMSEFIGE